MKTLVDRRNISKTNLGQMYSILDWCYHRGVADAYELNDLALVGEYLERNKEREPIDWGTINEPEMTWVDYLLTLIHRASRTAWRGFMRRYFNSIDRYGSSYLSCFIPLTLHWYNQGVEDYYNNPDDTDMSRFMDNRRVYWTKKGIIRVTSEDYSEEMVRLSFKYERRDRAIWEDNTVSMARRKGAMNPTFYGTFRRVVKIVANHKRNWI